MRVEPIKSQPTFGWSIQQQVTRYGSKMLKSTEYHTDNGLKLLVTDTFKNGKQTLKTKELYDNKWHLIKRKIIEYVNGKKGEIYYV